MAEGITDGVGRMTLARPNLNELVCDALREQIVSGQLKGGEKVIEDKIAKELSVSRTPMKLALIELAKEGFVELLPRRGAYVVEFKIQDIVQICEIRGLLEGLAAKMAAANRTDEDLKILESLLDEQEIAHKEYLEHEQMDRERDSIHVMKIEYKFHTTITNASKNKYLIGLEKSNHFILKSFLTIRVPLLKFDETIGDHRNIVEALRKRDGKVAEELMREHISVAKVALRDLDPPR